MPHLAQGMSSIVLTLTLILLLTYQSIAVSPCEPQFLRSFYPPLISQSQPQLTFAFNTNATCSRSYITVAYVMTIDKINCEVKEVRINATGDSSINTINSNPNDPPTPTQFLQYVHWCKWKPDSSPKATIANLTWVAYGVVDVMQQSEKMQIQQGDRKDWRLLRTQLNGQNDLGQQKKQLIFQSAQYPIQLPILILPLKLIILSDWAPIVTRTYIPLNKTLDYALQQRQVQLAKGKKSTNNFRFNGLLINGDVSYDLETDHCNKYYQFMRELQRVSPYWPLIINAGNHQSTRPKSMFLFEATFIIRNISSTNGDYSRVQPYRFTDRLSIILFDPFLEIYKTGTPEKYLKMKQKLLDTVEDATLSHPDELRLLVSHYPIACSQITDPHCRDARANMPDLYQQLSTSHRIDLYVGAHMHEYQRVYPLVDNDYVVGQQSPYQRGRMPSIVEGVAGCDYGIIDHQYDRQPFSVFATYNQTGFGIITVHAGQVPWLQYQHVVTNDIWKVVDGLVVGKDGLDLEVGKEYGMGNEWEVTGNVHQQQQQLEQQIEIILVSQSEQIRKD